MKFLLDSCISSFAVKDLREKGFEGEKWGTGENFRPIRVVEQPRQGDKEKEEI